MKLSVIAVATVALFASGISAKKDRDPSCCGPAQEGQQMCTEKEKAFGRIEHGIAECQSGKWKRLLKCPKNYACGKDPIPHCFTPTRPTKSVQQSWNLTILGSGNQTLQNSGNHTILKPGNLTITLKPEPSKGVAGRIVV